MARRDTRRLRRGGLLGAFAGFAIVCGVVLLLAGPRSPDGVSPPARHQLKIELHQALGHVQEAEEALGASDYGRSKLAIEQARRELWKLFGELEGLETGVPGRVDLSPGGGAR